MNSRYNNSDLDESTEDGREISLGTTTILGIFFALTLICAVCFGFGYAMRGRQTPPPPIATTPAETPAGTGQAKPSPVSLEPANPAPVSSATEDSPTIVPTGDTSTAQPDPAATAPVATPAAKPVSPARSAAPAPITASAAKPGTAVVQVAAVSHQQDADFLLAALKKRGYSASIRQEPQDKLLHVQLGPYASKKDATAIRDRLITDGYNPIVK